ncbi:unnamed protein product [marine sediment metagenome]|uniref:Uncharacterized protein n=1 Tax=marine sediment metagenome TaxID=412755 RepID=X1ML28_9ZZZZ
MADNLKDIIKRIEAENFEVMNWKPGKRRIFKVLDLSGNEVSNGMYSTPLL